MPPHMMDFPLLLSTLYERAVQLFPSQEIVSVESDRSIRRTTYAETDVNIRKLVTVFDQLGIEVGDAVGTFAWNNQRHHELYWATANTGRVCHTLNIRLFRDQLEFIINHAEDQVIFVDPDLAEVLEPLAEKLPTVRHYVVMGPEAPRFRGHHGRNPVQGGNRCCIRKQTAPVSGCLVQAWPVSRIRSKHRLQETRSSRERDQQ